MTHRVTATNIEQARVQTHPAHILERFDRPLDTDTIFKAIESGFVKSVHSFGSELGMEKYIAARGDVFFTGADGSIYTSITGEFRGWSKSGERFRLDNGQIWQITDSTSRLKVSMVNPEIVIEPGALGAWYMKVVGYNTRARVKRIK